MPCYPSGFKLLNQPRAYLDGRELSMVKSHKYLGVIICDDLGDDNDISRQLKCIYAKGNYLLRTFKHCSNEIKCKLFTAFCTNMYCGHLWASFTRTSGLKVRVGYNNVFRRLLGFGRRCSASGMFANCRVKSFGEIQRNLAFSFQSRLLNTGNSVVQLIFSIVALCKSSIVSSLRNVLFSSQLLL